MAETTVTAAPSGEGGSLYRLYTHPWFQIILISVICFCCPGMYNALGGLGGSGQVDPTVAANATVALLAATAVTALFIIGPIFHLIGPRWCLLIGGWTYPLYSGALLAFNHTKNGAFVIASGAILGVGAAFLWICQGAIMTSYVPERQKGRAIAVFWIIFNLGGGVGSLASFGLNYHSKSGTVTNSTYIALMVVMAVGWLLGVFICSPDVVRVPAVRLAIEDTPRNLHTTFRLAVETLTDWKVLLMLPLFFCANVFYSYQQNDVNGMTFNIRTRSLNGALYWFAQMFGGLVIGLILDLPKLNLSRPWRARLGWLVLFVSGMVIWGGGLAFQRWEDKRLAAKLKQDIDYTQGSLSVGPIFLYMFYGAYDALWQGYAYWLMGAYSNNPAVTAILVGTYKAFQAAGGAMAWRINALHKSAMSQFAMDWGLCMAALIVVVPSMWMVNETNGEMDEEVAIQQKVESKNVA